MPSPTPDLDTLLAQAKGVLANADAFNAGYVSDVNKAAQGSAALDQAQETHPLSDFFSGAWEGTKRLAGKYGSAAEGLGETLVDPIGTTQRTAGDLARHLAFDTPTEGAMSAADLSGLPVSSVAHDIGAKDWAGLAGDVAVAASLGALFHGLGTREPIDAATGAGLKTPIEPTVYPTREPFGPEPVPVTGSRPRPLQPVRDLAGSQPQTFDAAPSANLRVRNPSAEMPPEHTPYLGDDRPFTTGQFGLDFEKAAAPFPSPVEAGIAEEHGPSAAQAATTESTTPGDFRWDMSDFADQPAGSVVKDFTTDANGSTVEAPSPTPDLSKLFKPRIGAAEAAENLRKTGSVMGDLGPLDEGAYPKDEADATHRLGFYLENKALNTQWDGLRQEFRDTMRGGGGGDTGPSVPNEPSEPPTPPSSQPTSLKDMLEAALAKQEVDRARAAAVPADRVGHFSLPETNVSDEAFAKAAEAVNNKMATKGYAPQDIARLVPEVVSRPTNVASPSISGPNPLAEFFTNETGSVSPSAVVDAARTPINWQRAADVAHDVQIGNLVSGPSTVGKIGVSNLGSLLAKAIENSARDRSLTPLANAGRALTDVPAMGRDFVEGLRNGSSTARMELETTPPNKLQQLSRLLVRPVGAMDKAFRGVAERAGMTPDEASQIVQQQAPSTPFSQAALRLQRTVPGKILAPVMRSNLNLLEQGVWEPVKAAERLRTGTSANVGQDVAKLALAAGATAYGATGASTIDQLPHFLRPMALAAAGYYSIPAAIAYATAHAPKEGVRAAMTEAIRSVPLAQGFSPDLGNLLARLVPGPIRQANPDYWTGTKRDTHGIVEQLESKFPGLAQMLQVKRKGGQGRDTSFPINLPDLPELPQ